MRAVIRDASASDYPAIRAIIRHAFHRADEANLVEELRVEGAMLAELVAETNGGLHGHIAYSQVLIERDGGALRTAALAPISVLPAFQRHGVGAALIQNGEARCRALGCAAILVLGDAAYYTRFGFRADLTAHLQAPFAGPSFLALELQPGALKSGGAVRYAKAFGV